MNYGIMWFLFLLLIKMSLGSSSSISDSIFDTPPLATGRSLLQVATNCPVAFEYMNYTDITSRCKRPYSTTACCSAFKVFACPYADLLNDLTNNCATQMFSYLNINGNYPPGLFSSLCREGKEGLSCNIASPPQSSVNDNANGLQTASTSWPLQIFTPGLTLILFWIF